MNLTEAPTLSQIEVLLAQHGYDVQEGGEGVLQVRDLETGVSFQAALEGSAYARKLEWLRVGFTFVLAATAYLVWPQVLTTAALGIAGYAVISGVAFVFGTYNHDNDRNPAGAFG